MLVFKNVKALLTIFQLNIFKKKASKFNNKKLGNKRERSAVRVVLAGAHGERNLLGDQQ